jgi:hypothetical protein
MDWAKAIGGILLGIFWVLIVTFCTFFVMSTIRL